MINWKYRASLNYLKNMFWFYLILAFNCTLLQGLSAQVTYDNNATIIGAEEEAGTVQDTLTVPEGDDRLLVAFVMRNGNDSSTDSITYNGQHLTLQLQQSDGDDLNAEIWYLALQCGAAINDSLIANFSVQSGDLPDVIVAVATFNNVNQNTIFGYEQSDSGFGMSDPELYFFGTNDSTGLLIGTTVGEISFGSISITPDFTNMIEIFETSVDSGFGESAAEGCIKETTGGTDLMSWSVTDFIPWVAIGIELLASDVDGDGIPDCDDLCPADSLKAEPGICGCGVPDIDIFGN